MQNNDLNPNGSVNFRVFFHGGKKYGLIVRASLATDERSINIVEIVDNLIGREEDVEGDDKLTSLYLKQSKAREYQGLFLLTGMPLRKNG